LNVESKLRIQSGEVKRIGVSEARRKWRREGERREYDG